MKKSTLRMALICLAVGMAVGGGFALLESSVTASFANVLNIVFWVLISTFLALCVFQVVANLAYKTGRTGRFCAAFAGWRRRRLEQLSSPEVEAEWQKMPTARLPGHPLRGWRDLDNPTVMLECVGDREQRYYVVCGPPDGAELQWVAGLFVARRSELDPPHKRTWSLHLFSRSNHRWQAASDEELRALWSVISSSDVFATPAGQRCALCKEVCILRPADNGSVCLVGRTSDTSSWNERLIGVFCMHWKRQAAERPAPISNQRR